MSYGPEADARVDAASPNTNFGTVTSLPVDNSPLQTSYLRFQVNGVTSTVLSAKLRLFVTNGTCCGPPVVLAGNGWTELGITWNTQPAAISGPVDDKGVIAFPAWIDYNVTTLVGGDGTYTFTFTPQSSDAVDFNSRESATNQPLLVIEFCRRRTHGNTGAANSDPNVHIHAYAFSHRDRNLNANTYCDSGSRLPRLPVHRRHRADGQRRQASYGSLEEPGGALSRIPPTTDFHIYQLTRPMQAWTSTSTKIDTRTWAKIDALFRSLDQ